MFRFSDFIYFGGLFSASLFAFSSSFALSVLISSLLLTLSSVSPSPYLRGRGNRYIREAKPLFDAPFLSLSQQPYLLTSGDKGFDSALKGAALKENPPLALEALYPDVGAYPDHFPLIATAGMLLLEANYVPQLYLHNHSSCLKELG